MQLRGASFPSVIAPGEVRTSCDLSAAELVSTSRAWLLLEKAYAHSCMQPGRHAVLSFSCSLAQIPHGVAKKMQSSSKQRFRMRRPSLMRHRVMPMCSSCMAASLKRRDWCAACCYHLPHISLASKHLHALGLSPGGSDMMSVLTSVFALLGCMHLSAGAQAHNACLCSIGSL